MCRFDEASNILMTSSHSNCFLQLDRSVNPSDSGSILTCVLLWLSCDCFFIRCMFFHPSELGLSEWPSDILITMASFRSRHFLCLDFLENPPYSENVLTSDSLWLHCDWFFIIGLATIFLFCSSILCVCCWVSGPLPWHKCSKGASISTAMTKA